ncbi:MAG: hypothetical protein LBJ64_03815 [Deltaproteobacteria bacterium]|nr:hypothetical protein [Deltaproteobacteria bacterium]
MAAPASPAAEAGSVVGLMAANAGTGETAGLEAAVGAGQLPQIPRPLSAYSMAHLYELISREPPLTRNEIVIYRKNLSAIVALNADPAGLGPILEATGLTQQRLTYVVTKIGVGLSYLLYPESPKLRHLPDYLKPSSLEEELIADQLDELVNDFHKLYAPEVKPRKRAVSRKRP